MKRPIIFTTLCLSAAFILTAVWQTVSHPAEPPIRQFSVKQLTSQQIAACSEFKASTNRPRHSELERVQKLGILPYAPFIEENSVLHTAKAGLHAIFPWWFGSATSNISCDYEHPTFMMTREDVIDLLGVPSSSDSNNLRYSVGYLGGGFHFFIVNLHSGYVVGTGGMEIH
jgi:hypothetical protein